MNDSFVNLNPTQMEAVTSTEGFIRVIAGAGSGKTRALTHRFAYLVNEVGILPGNILCVTFTNKAADEMRQRIHLLTGDNDTGYICTFHSFCVSILQEDSFTVQYPKSFLVLDYSDIDDMLRIIYAERGLTLRDMTFRDARDMIEIQKLFKKPDYYLDMIEMSLDTLHDKYMQATETKEIILAAKDFCNLVWLENLNLRGDYRVKILNWIHENRPELDGLYKEIYTYKDRSYWYALDEEMKEFTAQYHLPYLRDDDSKHSDFGEPPVVINYFFHEEVKKSVKQKSTSQ